MSQLSPPPVRLLRPHILRLRIDSSVLKARIPIHHNQSRCGFATTTSKKMATGDDSSTQILYEPLEGIERLEYYRPGGYHPVQIGDHFQGRYRVVHKLGHGSYSTKWLAHDRRNHKYVAMKICTANSNPKDPGMTMVPSILDTFTIRGPNGNHACYITAPARASLAGLKDGSQGIVHGDLHMGNTLLKTMPGFDQLSIDQLYERYGAPELDPIVHLDGKPLPPGVPTHGIAPIWLGEPSEEITLTEARILLSDFGEASVYSKEPKYESHTPLIIRPPPPEARFEPNKPLSFSSDIWTLACTIWAIIAQRPLFEGFLATEDDMTREQVDTLGILPPEWWRRWEVRSHKFIEDGVPINRNHFRSWKDRFEDSVQQPRQECGMSLFDATERDAIFDMLRPMFSFRPEDRSTTQQILKSEWMAKWALPEYERIRQHD
ncbi:kinase-like protein [Aspergillus homomorphus CBS 101889]|uniref:non-specific serine/threonine protein kinase n=1 Tax=Aspergillus homomorphus (strain CBS 101889) TaxID=1450537 RepID=A0A395HW52_ASPHC|nr:kinase-like protein [Aspergillus homomorphus CBS 101889]RAL12027.1 kinase-like protein [Aspergillus homomorphus CBS 101889]